MSWRTCFCVWSCGLLVGLPWAHSAPVVIETVTIGNPENAPANGTGLGSVPYEYQMGKYEVTNEQYIEFLRAKAPGNSSLYSSPMASQPQGGIVRSGTAGSYVYTLKPGMEQMPVIGVDWYSATRFVNWLQNGQGNANIDQGTYSVLIGTGYTRAPGGNQWVLPNRDEWYKAAYHQPAADGGDADDYWLYATGTNAVPYSDKPGDTDAPDLANRANVAINDSIANGYNDGFAVTGTTSATGLNTLSPVGAYSLASSYYGTFDQTGNVYEWLENGGADYRAYRGGSWTNEFNLTSFSALTEGASGGDINVINLGFRVAWVPEIPIVPEPSSLAMAAMAFVGLIGYGIRRCRVGR